MDLIAVVREKLDKIKGAMRAIFKKDFIIGLDIGGSSIKIAQFIKKEDGPHLVKIDLREIKGSGDSALREEEILSTLKGLFRGIDLKKSKIIASINCPHTAIKKVQAPFMPKAELKEGIRLEAKNYFPFTVDDASLDFQILGDVFEKGVRKYEVIVAVSPQKTVDRYLSLLGKAGIRPASLVPASYALQRTAEHLYSKEDETRCFIDIGELHTELIITKGTRLMFSRKIPVAGSDFTKAMTGILVSDRGKTELSIDEAEKIKKDVGIPSECESKIIEGKISTTQVLSMLRTPLEQLVNEIERCFDYYREESGGRKVDAVIVFGGGASLAGLVRYLSEGLGLEVRIGDPLGGISIEKDAVREREKVSHRLELAMGAALDGAKGLNLLPVEIKEAAKRVVKRGVVEAVTTAVILASILLYIGMRIQLVNFERRISVAKLELSGLRAYLEKEEAQALANKVLMDEPQWEDVFIELSNLIPDDITMERISVDDNIIAMQGVISAPDGEQILADFILTLENGIFKNVKLIESKDLGEKHGCEFELKCWVDYQTL